MRRDVPRRSEADGDVARPGRDTRKAAVRGSCEVVAALLIFYNYVASAARGKVIPTDHTGILCISHFFPGEMKKEEKKTMKTWTNQRSPRGSQARGANTKG